MSADKSGLRKAKNKHQTRAAVVAVSVGCPAGIGPEVSLRAADKMKGVRALLVCAEPLARSIARRYRIAQKRLVMVNDEQGIRAIAEGEIGIWAQSASLEAVVPGKPTADCGRAQLAWIDQACDLVSSGHCDALVTGPVSKEIIASSSGRAAKRFRGHTEHLARRLGVERVTMAFRSERITTSLVTTHLPLKKVPRAITADGVAEATMQLVDLLQRLGHEAPRVAIASLNPHAGEGGLLGTEEVDHIAPGIAQARRKLPRRSRAVLTGPVGAETAYRWASTGSIDGVVAMYHDQATIPCKILGFGEAVNVTLGLPIIRTSVDHGTAYDCAGTATASSRGMLEAMSLASALIQSGKRRKR